MTKHKTKNDKFKVSGMLPKRVRLPHSSAEASVMEVERRGQQSSRHTLKFYPSNITGIGRQRRWKGKPYQRPWLRHNLGLWRVFPSRTKHLPLPARVGVLYGEAISELDGTKALRVDRTFCKYV